MKNFIYYLLPAFLLLAGANLSSCGGGDDEEFLEDAKELLDSNDGASDDETSDDGASDDETFDDETFDDGTATSPEYNEEGLPINIANNTIVYKTSDNSTITITLLSMGGVVVKSNTYSATQGYGIIEFESEVTAIGLKAFYERERLVSVVLPNSVKTIGADAFSGCTSLASVTIGRGVTGIYSQAFKNCEALVAVYISDLAAWCNIDFSPYDSSPLRYAKNLYLNGEKVTNLVIPDGVKEIKQYAFKYCTGLTSVTIPNSVTSIGPSAFDYCTGLTAVYISDLATWCNIDFLGHESSNPLYYAKNLYLNGEKVIDLVIPDGVKEIKQYAFKYCTGLTSVTIPASVGAIGNWAFDGCIDLTSVKISSGVKSIGNFAFRDCKALARVIIPNSVTSIGSSAFGKCASLTKIYAESSTPATVNWFTFGGLYSQATLYVPRGSKATYSAADYWKDFKNIVEVDY